MQTFKQINELRNSTVHRGESLTLEDLKTQLFPEMASAEAETIYLAMAQVLREVCMPA